MRYRYVQKNDECDYYKCSTPSKTHIKKETAKALNDAMDEAYSKLCEVLAILNGEKDCDSLTNFLYTETDFIQAIEGVMDGIEDLRAYNWDVVESIRLYEFVNAHNSEVD